MPTIKINKEELEFEYIYYCDSVNGNDSRDGLTEATSLKTIQAAINKIVINTNSAIALLPNSLFTGAVANTGFINIPANKQITFIGRLLNNNPSTIPIIRSTEYNCIQNLSVKEINFINIRIESLGSQGTGGGNNYATLLQQPINNTICNFYNCYLKPRGIIFNSGSILNVYNSIIDYDKHNFVSDIFWYFPQYDIYSGPKKFYNSIILDTMTCRSTDSDTAIFYNSIVPSTNLTWHNFTSNTNKRLETSLSTIDSELQVALDTSYYINQGTGINPDGTTANIGIYGGPYAFGNWTKRYFFFDNGLYKTYDVENETWITPIGSNTPTPEDYETYGMSSFENVNFTTLTNPNNIIIKTYTTDVDEASILNVIGVIAKPNKLIFPLNNIDEVILENKIINFITVNAIVSGNGVVKTILSFDNGATWWGYSASLEQFINVVDLTEESNYLDVADYGITPSVLASIPSTQIEQLRGVDKKNTLRVAYYISAPDIYSVASVDSISINTSEKGNWEGSVVNTDYTYYHATNKTIIKLQTSGSYKVNYFPEDVAMKVEADALENAGIDSWNDLKDKPLFYPAETHTHDIPNIESLSNIILNLSDSLHSHVELHTHSNLDILDKISYINNKPYFNNVLWPGAEDRPGNTFVSLLDTPESYEDTTEEFIKVKSDASGLEYAHITYSVPVTNVSIKNKHAKRYSFIFGGG